MEQKYVDCDPIIEEDIYNQMQKFKEMCEEIKQETDDDRKNELISELNTGANIIIFQHKEYLHNIFKEIMNTATVKSCIDFKDPDYNTVLLNYAKSKNNIYLDDSDFYKILLKGHSGIITDTCVTALYLPKHIKIIYINAYLEINIEETFEIEQILDESKLLPTFETEFYEKYRKVILMEPFIPKCVTIAYDSPDMFYFEAYVSESELDVNPLKYFIEDKEMNVDYPYKTIVRNTNDNMTETFKTMGYRQQVYFVKYINKYFIEYVNPEFVDFSALVFSDDDLMEEEYQIAAEKCNNIRDKLSNKSFHIMEKNIIKHNDLVSGMFLADCERYTPDLLDAYDDIYVQFLDSEK